VQPRGRGAKDLAYGPEEKKRGKNALSAHLLGLFAVSQVSNAF